MSKYTPGPWYVIGGGLQDIHAKDGTHLFRSVRRDLKGAELSHQKANAQLASAAPELLDALEKCKKVLSSENARLRAGGLTYESIEAQDKAWAAIKKARGEKA